MIKIASYGHMINAFDKIVSLPYKDIGLRLSSSIVKENK